MLKINDSGLLIASKWREWKKELDFDSKLEYYLNDQETKEGYKDKLRIYSYELK